MKNYDKNKEPFYLQYRDSNNLYGWTMTQKLPAKHFVSSKLLPNLKKISWKTILRKIRLTSQWFTIFSRKNKHWKSQKKLVANIYDQAEYVIHIRNLKEALNHELFLKIF